MHEVFRVVRHQEEAILLQGHRRPIGSLGQDRKLLRLGLACFLAYERRRSSETISCLQELASEASTAAVFGTTLLAAASGLFHQLGLSEQAIEQAQELVIKLAVAEGEDDADKSWNPATERYE